MFVKFDKLISKNSTFEDIFSQPSINIKKLRQYAWCGIPHNHRKKAYRFLLEINSLQTDRYYDEISDNNRIYFEKILNVGKVLSNGGCYVSQNSFVIDIDRKISKQIEIDVDRIPTQYLMHNKISLKFIYKNILKVIAKHRPAVGYVQGMADLLIPLVEIYKDDFFVESSVYFIFSKLLNAFQYYFIDGQEGIKKAIKKAKKVLKIVDPHVYTHFASVGLEIHMFAFRWFNCLFVREFRMEYYLMLLDSMLATNNYELFIVYFAVSLIVSLRKEILSRDFNELLIFMQNLSTLDWKYSELRILFASVYVNVNVFEEKFYYDF